MNSELPAIITPLRHILRSTPAQLHLHVLIRSFIHCKGFHRARQLPSINSGNVGPHTKMLVRCAHAM